MFADFLFFSWLMEYTCDDDHDDDVNVSDRRSKESVRQNRRQRWQPLYALWVTDLCSSVTSRRSAASCRHVTVTSSASTMTSLTSRQTSRRRHSVQPSWRCLPTFLYHHQHHRLHQHRHQQQLLRQKTTSVGRPWWHHPADWPASLSTRRCSVEENWFPVGFVDDKPICVTMCAVLDEITRQMRLSDHSVVSVTCLCC